MRTTTVLTSPEATRQAAAALAQQLNPGDFVALWGDLGAGKTAFARALIQTLAPHETEVPSPTFTLVQRYETPRGPVFHFDLYRLGAPDDIYALDWEEARVGICLVEWPERLGALLPTTRLDLRLDYGDQEDTRILTLDRPSLP